jgi:hypothetical protein
LSEITEKWEVAVNGSNLCRPCAQGAYFNNAQEVTWPGMDWTPSDSRQETDSSGQKEAACAQQVELGEAERRGNGDPARRD